MSEVMEQLRRLPMRPTAAGQVLSVMDDPDVSAREVASALQTDPALCARILHLANSPYFGLTGKVGSVERAVIALGAAVVRSLAISTAAGLFGDRPDQMPKGFWRHSVAVAAGASIAARFAHVPAGDALCAGLLHDLGSALLFRADPEGHAALDRDGGDGEDRLASERARYDGDHATIGALALDTWHLPPVIVDAIRHHHADPRAVTDKLTRVVIIGEALAHAADPDTYAHEPAADPIDAFSALGLTAVSVDNLIRRTAEEAEALDAVLHAVR
jgi:putative nucleotidyltransferase with HDIG domain